jgi:DMSO/TMAO reductase YedYZ molybdopterin-dependent catalytic subunit
MTLWLSLCLLAATPDAGALPSLQVEGAQVKAATLQVKDLEALGAVTVGWSDKSGQHQVTGVRLDKVLLHAGFSEGAMGPTVDPKVKHAGLRTAVVALASDGYQAVFSVGELLESLGATQALVVWAMDGQPLPPKFGPLRLIVTTDKGASRSLHQLVTLRLVDLR